MYFVLLSLVKSNVLVSDQSTFETNTYFPTDNQFVKIVKYVDYNVKIFDMTFFCFSSAEMTQQHLCLFIRYSFLLCWRHK